MSFGDIIELKGDEALLLGTCVGRDNGLTEDAFTTRECTQDLRKMHMAQYTQAK